MTIDLSRRKFLHLTGLGSSFALTQGIPLSISFAKTINHKKLLVVILRGAMDGLAAVPPIGDKAYADARGAIALPQNDDNMLILDGYFALHSALKPLMPLYLQKQFIIFHAVATPYRSRSHFDAQNLLENGTDRPNGQTTGWLNRTLSTLTHSQGMALGESIPLMLRGHAKVGSWSPEILPDVDNDFLMRVAHMYQSDSLLLDALTSGQKMQSMTQNTKGQPQRYGQKAFIDTMQKAALFMSPANGANIATIEMGGWDTHANQGLGNGRLANNFQILSEGLINFQKNMGTAWRDTAVLCLTEFGRTVKGNGTGGTDHGTASVAFLLGGNIHGGRVIGDWPTLTKLHEGRDLIPANDMRGVIKATLHQHLGISQDVLDNTIFPNSANIWLKEQIFV
jgi:uncharacterized protein (DUF1501 family)